MSNKQYFTQDTENAIIKYNQTQDDIFRNNIFEYCKRNVKSGINIVVQ